MCIDRQKYTFKNSKAELTSQQCIAQKIDKSNNSTQPIKRYRKKRQKNSVKWKNNFVSKKNQYGSASHRTKKITGKIYLQ